MAAPVQLTVRDSGALNIIQNLRLEITGGIHEEEGADIHQKGPFTVAEVAAVNEFGAGKIPPRPWLRGWADGPRAKDVVKMIRGAMQAMARTQMFESAPFEDITNWVLNSIREQFLQGTLRPANAPLTLKNKAPETRPLVETHQLEQALRGRLDADVGAAHWKHEAK